MAENIIMDFIVQNWFLLYMIGFNFFLIILLVMLRMTLGPFFTETLKVSVGLMKNPNLFIRFTNSKTAVIEWRSYNQVIKVEPDNPESDLVYVDRENGYSARTPNRKGGLFGFFGKKPLEELYTDDLVPVKIDETAGYWVFGRQLNIIYEGQNITQNPLKNFTQDAQVSKAGIAVEHQLIANKLLAENEFRNKIATKDDVRNFGLLNLIVLGVGIAAIIVLALGMSESLNGFISFAQSTWANYQPAVEEILSNIPRVVPG